MDRNDAGDGSDTVVQAATATAELETYDYPEHDNDEHNDPQEIIFVPPPSSSSSAQQQEQTTTTTATITEDARVAITHVSTPPSAEEESSVPSLLSAVQQVHTAASTTTIISATITSSSDASSTATSNCGDEGETTTSVAQSASIERATTITTATTTTTTTTATTGIVTNDNDMDDENRARTIILSASFEISAATTETTTKRGPGDDDDDGNKDNDGEDDYCIGPCGGGIGDGIDGDDGEQRRRNEEGDEIINEDRVEFRNMRNMEQQDEAFVAEKRHENPLPEKSSSIQSSHHAVILARDPLLGSSKTYDAHVPETNIPHPCTKSSEATGHHDDDAGDHDNDDDDYGHVVSAASCDCNECVDDDRRAATAKTKTLRLQLEEEEQEKEEEDSDDVDEDDEEPSALLLPMSKRAQQHPLSHSHQHNHHFHSLAGRVAKQELRRCSREGGGDFQRLRLMGKWNSRNQIDVDPNNNNPPALPDCEAVSGLTTASTPTATAAAAAAATTTTIKTTTTLLSQESCNDVTGMRYSTSATSQLSLSTTATTASSSSTSSSTTPPTSTSTSSSRSNQGMAFGLGGGDKYQAWFSYDTLYRLWYWAITSLVPEHLRLKGSIFFSEWKQSIIKTLSRTSSFGSYSMYTYDGEPWWQPLWKITFAIVAIVDIVLCWPVLVEGWYQREMLSPSSSEEHFASGSGGGKSDIDAIKTSQTPSGNSFWESLFGGGGPLNDGTETCPVVNHRNNNATCPTSLPSSVPYYYHYPAKVLQYAPGWNWVGPVFCFFCIVEALIRAREARILAIELNALDNFEKKLTRVYSTTRMSFMRLQTATQTQLDEVLAKQTLRTWIPVASVLFFWFTLLPLRGQKYSFFNHQEKCGGSDDGALATMWITQSILQWSTFLDWLGEKVLGALWHAILPFDDLWHKPRKLVARVKLVLKYIRYIRFAGPLIRMLMKLWDQLWALIKTWRQSITARAEKAKRLARRSMLFEDLKRIESLTKVQTALASLPSQLFHLAQHEMHDIGVKLAERQKEGRDLRHRLQKLKEDVGHSFESTGALYDRMVQMTRDIQSAFTVDSLYKRKKNFTLSSLLTSHEYLIDPHSRFGVVWRVTVTNCLLLELFRLTVSWRMTETFKLSLTQIINKLFVHCDQTVVKKRFRFFTDRVEDLHAHLARVFPLLEMPPPDDFIICSRPSSLLSRFYLWLGGYLEDFIDFVCFFDIFIWFFTGELDIKGVVVPKPFFSRCILPGTLVQVLDHPTLPQTLPALIGQAMDAAHAAGFSRVIRWSLAIGPAFIMLVIKPLLSYFFRHMDTKQGMMSMAESCGMLASPRQLSRYSSHWSTYGDNLNSMHSLQAVPSQPSQIGMSFADSFAGLPLSPRPTPTIAGGGRKIVSIQANYPFNDLTEQGLDDSYSFSYSTLQY